MADENRQIESQKNPGSTGRRRPIVAKVRQVENQRRIAVALDDKRVAEWRARMQQIFATASPLFVEASIQQLIEAAAKLELAFHDAIETFYRIKRGASQVIRIEKVEVQSGGKAVVGFIDHK